MAKDNNQGLAELFTDAAQGFLFKSSNLKQRITDRCHRFIEKYRQALITIAALLIISLLTFGFGWVKNGFTLPLSGDGYLQEQTFPYAFYDAWHRFFATGQFPQWNTSSALGTNNIGGNTFYSLLSPFQILMLPFPRNWIPYLLGLRYIFSTALAGFLFYLYLNKFNLSVESRRAGGAAYAFCGWVMYFLWFEHFLDSFVLLPLILWGIENVIRSRDPRLLIVSLAVQGITNYFFMVSFCIGGAFYAIFRWFTCWRDMQTWKNRLAVLGIGVACFLAGVLSCCFVLLPGIANAMSLPRVESSSYLDKLLAAIKGEGEEAGKTLLQLLFKFDNDVQGGYPAAGFFFMTIRCFSSNILGVYYYDNAAGSSFVFTPMMLLAFSGFIEGFRQKKISWIIGPLLVGFMICTPFFYYLFAGFTLAYARFLLIPSAWIIAFAATQMNRIREKPRWTMDAAFAVLVIMQGITGIYSYGLVTDNPSLFEGVSYVDLRFIIVPVAIAISLISYLVLRHFMKASRIFAHASLIIIGCETIIMGNVTLINHGYGSLDSMVQYDGKNYGLRVVKNEQEMISDLKRYDPTIFRIQNADASRSNPNLPMTVGYSGLSAFNSVYTVNAQDFLDWSRFPYTYHNWSMGEHGMRINMEAFLGVKYYIVPRGDYNVPFGFKDVMTIDPASIEDQEKSEALQDLQATIQKYYSMDQTNLISRSLYVNEDYVNFAFPFDTVISSGSLYSGDYADYNEYTYLRYGIVDKDQTDALQKAIAGTGIEFHDTDEFYSANNTFSSTDSLTFNLTKSSEHTYSGTVTYNRAQRSFPIVLDSNEEDGSLQLSSTRYGIAMNFANGSNTTKFQGLNAIDALATRTASGSDLTIQTSLFYPIRAYDSSSRSKITVYSANWDDKTGKYITGYDKDGNPLFDVPSTGFNIFPGDTVFDYDSPKEHSLYGLKWWTKLVIEPRATTVFAPDASPEHPAYISIKSADNFDWYFIDTKGEKVSLDGLQSYSSYQNAHGFYVDRPIAKIIGTLHDTKKASESIGRPAVYVQSYADYRLATDKLNESPVEIESQDTDQTRFKTSYDRAKYVVINQPFEDGWSLVEISRDQKGNQVEKPVETFKGQGGFVAFIAPAGEHEYQLSYTAPGFNLGVKATIVGLVLGGLMQVQRIQDVQPG